MKHFKFIISLPKPQIILNIFVAITRKINLIKIDLSYSATLSFFMMPWGSPYIDRVGHFEMHFVDTLLNSHHTIFHLYVPWVCGWTWYVLLLLLNQCSSIAKSHVYLYHSAHLNTWFLLKIIWLIDLSLFCIL